MTIRLQDIELQARIGVFPGEKEKGNTFRVSVSITLPTPTGTVTDRLEDTFNYQTLYDVVAEEMARPADLLEHVACRIQAHLQAIQPEAQVHVSISKKNPPLGGQVAWATIEI